ncbi:hypothetical protein [Halosimplex pelagicum]|uniref:Uncharacterized protein n=1 Tax=Halosimplex pelagicum TaxID=869886 RepID=A0A7D5PER6_9EURY|nr:hypothetical protein [Halosimplex pelagicum]QLH82340.1 hypothetical protein HZS54_12260 [Halosimplex pelagicum]
MSEHIDPRTTPAREYPVKGGYREKLSEEEVYERLDNVVEDDLIEIVLWQGYTMKAQLIVTDVRETELTVQSKHGECRLPKANTFNGSIVGHPSLYRDGDKLGLIEYVLHENDIPSSQDPSEASAGYNL